ncbi:SMP-30/gluconolactonase/LRE family protein [Legionella sp. W05-934-2]|jgi:sugar lactone lactonase YvrE|uniref:SMP-30/gluconolactonase/LRE family protein n=1 Tax=Legionella sp. W05-934-2 TaxID=1198649 RepID=UPI003461B98E
MICITQTRNQLGESPAWHPHRKQFYWVDITQMRIHTLLHDLQTIETISLPSPVGCIVLADNGNLIAALARDIVEVNLSTQEIHPLYHPELPDNVMFNDGKVDCMGRLWVGTKDISEQNPIAALYCFDGYRLSLKQDNVIVSNGTDWSLDNAVMYYTDSPRQQIYQYDFDSQSGTIHNQRVFAQITKGYPDGLTVDNQGRVWSTHWDGGCITCYTPDGNVDKVIPMGVKRPTSCCFGGENYQQLCITSASMGLEGTPQDKDGYLFLDDSLAIGKPSFLFKMPHG